MSPRDICRYGGLIVALVGLLCLPVGYGVSPRRDQSAFYNLADTSAFVQWGVVLIAVGVAAMVIARWLPSDRWD